MFFGPPKGYLRSLVKIVVWKGHVTKALLKFNKTIDQWGFTYSNLTCNLVLGPWFQACPSMCCQALWRQPDEEEAGNRPHKRIALETGEVAAESDVVNLQKPYLAPYLVGKLVPHYYALSGLAFVILTYQSWWIYPVKHLELHFKGPDGHRCINNLFLAICEYDYVMGVLGTILVCDVCW
jgi:hypothetical protein